MKLPNEPTRYVTDVEGNLEPHRGGGLILWSDYHALRSLCEQLKEDAERYRWLRQHPIFLGWDEDYSDSGIDREVDAARKESDDKG